MLENPRLLGQGLVQGWSKVSMMSAGQSHRPHLWTSVTSYLCDHYSGNQTLLIYLFNSGRHGRHRRWQTHCSSAQYFATWGFAASKTQGSALCPAAVELSARRNGYSLQTVHCKRHIFISLSRTSERAKLGGLPDRLDSFRVMYSAHWGRASSCWSRVHSSGWQTGMWEGGWVRGERFIKHPLDNGLRTPSDLEQRPKEKNKTKTKTKGKQIFPLPFFLCT